MSFKDKIEGCYRCGCPKEEIEYLNCGPIIRIRCPICECGMTEGVDTPPGVEALIETWNHAGDRYREALAALYEAQDNSPLPVRVQYGDESITGIVTVVDCRKDIFDIEMPGGL